MSLLEQLFPGIKNNDFDSLPEWTEPDSPWIIFSDGANGISSQIRSHSSSSEGVFIHPTATIGDYVTIEGPCYIGANAVIKHRAYLRPGSWISHGALVGNCTEIKNSILLPYSKAPHFNYIGDSMLGFHVNVGAGVKLSNVRHDGEVIYVKDGNGIKHNSGLRKLGALLGDGSKLGCNAVTNPGTMVSPGTMIDPNVNIGGWVN